MQAGDNQEVKEDFPKTLANGRYQLQKSLHGTTGDVGFLAHDLKFVRPVMARRLQPSSLREAQILATLNHSGIPRVLQVLTEGDEVWMISEWLEGVSLADLPSPVPEAALCAMMFQVFDALACVHAAGIVHRNVKPKSIVLCPTGRVVLGDFCSESDLRTDDPHGEAPATSYSDIRLLEGKQEDVHSDLFATTLILLELYSGEKFLPAMPRTQLYPYLKEHLEARLAEVTIGAYPPLARLVTRFLRRPLSTPLPWGNAAARTAAKACEELCERLAGSAPQKYLASKIAEGTFDDEEVRKALAKEAVEILADGDISPLEKPSWLTFSRHLTGRARSPQITLPQPPALGTNELEQHREKQRIRWRFPLLEEKGFWIALAIVIIVVLAGAGWRALRQTQFRTSAGNQTEMYSGKGSQSKRVVAVTFNINTWAFVTVDDTHVRRIEPGSALPLQPGQHTLLFEGPHIEPLRRDLLVPDSEEYTFSAALSIRTH